MTVDRPHWPRVEALYHAALARPRGPFTAPHAPVTRIELILNWVATLRVK